MKPAVMITRIHVSRNDFMRTTRDCAAMPPLLARRNLNITRHEKG